MQTVQAWAEWSSGNTRVFAVAFPPRFRYTDGDLITERRPRFCYAVCIIYNDTEVTAMKRILLLLFSLLALTGCAAKPQTAGTYRQITMEEAMEMMEKEKDFIILDVRTVAEYESGHIPGAICVPNESIGTEEIPELPDKKQLILVYCRSGNRSKQASEKLVKLGYTNIVEFGGINSWPGEIAKP